MDKKPHNILSLQQMTVAGIVTFNPDMERLRANVEAILPQVAQVVIFDNASDNFDDISSAFAQRCVILEHRHKNVGIATALNLICQYCTEQGYKWVLTLDQDSICPFNLIEDYTKAIDIENVGIISPRIVDRNIGDIDPIFGNPVSEIDFCITSASLVNLDAWKAVGGFWDELFIDMVDFDMCWSLKEKGYRIIRVNTVSLCHELGHSTIACFRGKKVAVFNHSPHRYYYIVRNTIAVGRRHHRRMQCFRWNIKRLWLVIRYESGTGAKLKAMAKGLFDGLFNRIL